MNDKVLIDTCAWIDYLRAKEGQLGDEVATAIESQLRARKFPQLR